MDLGQRIERCRERERKKRRKRREGQKDGGREEERLISKSKANQKN